MRLDFPSSFSYLFSKLKLLKLDDLYKHQLCIYMYKSTKGLLPDSMSSMVIPIHNVHDHNLRNQNGYYIHHVRTNCRKFTIHYTGQKIWNTLVGQPPARGPDPAHEGLASGPPTFSAITLQSGPRNPSQTKTGFMSEITSRECTNSEHFGRLREPRCTLRRLLIKYKNSKSRCRQTNSNNYNVGLSHALEYLQRAQVTVSHNPISSS